MLAHKLPVGIHLSVEISFILIVLFSVETNDEQNTVDMSLKDLAESGIFLFVFWFLFVQEKRAPPTFNDFKYKT